MTCQASRFNSVAGLYMETWCGEEKINGTPTLLCSIDDQTEAIHYVEVQNVKTYSRTVFVKGLIEAANNKAKFEGSTISDEQKWKDSGTLYGTLGSDTMSFDSVQIVKKRKGQETIKVEIEYEDSWNHGKIKRATNPSNELTFKVDLS